MPVRVLGNVCHEFFATEIYAEHIVLAKPRPLEESVNSLQNSKYFFRLIANRTVERTATLTIRNQGEGRDTTVLTATVNKGDK